MSERSDIPLALTPAAPARPTNSLWRRWTGPLTRELLRRPGDFGLGQVPERLKPDATTEITCGFCSTGCGLTAHLREGQAINLTPSTEHPVNLGMACPKGWEALSVLSSPDRAATPLLRGPDGELRPVDWHTAMNAFVSRLRDVGARHGPEAIAFLSTGQIANEEMAALGILAKFGMGMVHGDGNTRQCMATAVVAYKQALGFDAPPYTYADFEASDVVVLVGSNLAIAHPIMWERLSLNRNNPALVVVDPRRTETAAHAREHLAIRPKSDLVLLYALAHVLIREGWIDHGFIARSTTGFEAFARHVSDFTPARASIETGVSEEQLLRTAQIIGRGKAVSYWWTMGVNQSHEGVRVAQALINLALITGQIGRPGAGANSITGQCNAMGSRLVSNTTNLIGGYDFKSPDDRRHVASCLGIDPALIPDRDSWAYPEIIEGVRRGQIKALWIIATNTAHSWMDQNELREVWGKLDFLVVQDMYHSTETARLADLLLPAAGWGEKDGTIINSERRVGLLKKVSRAPGVALADFAIFKLIAHYWGCDSLFEGWDSPEHAFRVLQRLSKGKPWDITGIDGYAMLDRCHGVQWPFTRADAARGDPQPERRLFADGVFHHPDGRARLIFEQPRPMPEPPSDRWPFVLLTGRGTASQWHTQTRTAKSAVLRSLYPAQPYVEVHPDDAQRLDLKHGEPARVSTPRGAMTALAMVTPTVQPGQLFIPMHYPGTNLLTRPDFDPYSRQPSYKACAARIEAPVAAPSDAGV